MLDEQQQAYHEEAGELLTELESSLLELEENPEDQEIIGQVFRAMHTIKGSGAMFGFDNIATFTHEVETTFDLVRSGKLPVTQQLIDLSLAARDRIRMMLESSITGEDVDTEQTEALADKFRKMAGTKVPENTGAGENNHPEKGKEDKSGNEKTWRIRFKPVPEIMLTGTRPISLINELREMGFCTAVIQTEQIPFLNDLEPEKCFVHWDIILTTSESEEAIHDVFIFVEDECELTVSLIDEHDLFQEDATVLKLGEILIEKGDLSAEDLEQIFQQKPRIGEVLVDANLVTKDKVESALAEQRHLKVQRQKQQEKDTSSGSLRVPAERLDNLVDLVGELVTVQSRLSQTAIQRNDTDLLSIAEEVERLTEELRDQTLNIRMLPIGTTFSKFRRLVRDMSRSLNKKIELKTFGAETELDKIVIEKLNDPLVHLLRNSLDHGLEPEEERIAAGKQATGTITLSAEHSGDSVIVEIRDDGRGLNRDAIRAKAIQNGIIQETDHMEESELYQLIFAPGFSTAKAVTDVSGRGVGMDVVKRAIESLRGSIEIESMPGTGTCIQIRIPLTLAIIESLLVDIGGSCYVLPLSTIEECIELSQEDIQKAHGRHLINVRDSLISYIPLREFFGIHNKTPDIQQIVITRTSGHRVGFVVDKVIGEHQTVIKTLGPMYRDAIGISGATILGDGSVALILDIIQLARHAEQQEKEA